MVSRKKKHLQIEACPIALQEAMAARRAVIASHVGGTPEVVTHMVDGWLIPSDDPAALAQAMLVLLENPDHRSAMGTAAHQKVVTQFTQDYMVQETLAFYRRLLAGA